MSDKVKPGEVISISMQKVLGENNKTKYIGLRERVMIASVLKRARKQFMTDNFT